jgi:hypothetical protein
LHDRAPRIRLGVIVARRVERGKGDSQRRVATRLAVATNDGFNLL